MVGLRFHSIVRVNESYLWINATSLSFINNLGALVGRNIRLRTRALLLDGVWWTHPTVLLNVDQEILESHRIVAIVKGLGSSDKVGGISREKSALVVRRKNQRTSQTQERSLKSERTNNSKPGVGSKVLHHASVVGNELKAVERALLLLGGCHVNVFVGYIGHAASIQNLLDLLVVELCIRTLVRSVRLEEDVANLFLGLAHRRYRTTQ